jgi:hypothetical protein
LDDAIRTTCPQCGAVRTRIDLSPPGEMLLERWWKGFFAGFFTGCAVAILVRLTF